VEWNDGCAWAAIVLCEICDAPSRQEPLIGVSTKHIEFNGMPTAGSMRNGRNDQVRRSRHHDPDPRRVRDPGSMGKLERL
jgi:hypothetical protein